MLCQEAAERYATETEAKEKDLILEETLQKISRENERRHQELVAFIDDFVDSEEFLEYQKAKENICKCEKSTQYDLEELNNIIIEFKNAEVVEEKYPLTRERKKLFAFNEQFEKYAERRQNLEILEGQQRGMNTIKDKMVEAKKIFECTRETRQKLKDARDNALLSKFSKKLNVDLTDLSAKTQKIVLERLRHEQETFKIRKLNRRQNVVNILEKLLFERKMKLKEQEKANKTYDYKVRRREKIIKGMEVVGTKIELIDPSTLVKEPIVEEEISFEKPNEEEEPFKKIKGRGKSAKDKDKVKTKKKERSSDKSSKSSKSKKEKKTKTPKGKKKEKGVEKFKLPPVPITNPRDKIFPEDLEQMVDLIEEFRRFDNTLEDEFLKWQNGKNYETDFAVEVKPNAIIFQNFKEGNTYTKTVKVRNVSTDIKKCRFGTFLFENQYDEIAFHIEYFGIQKLYTGCYFKFSISFKPWDNEKAFDGKIRFVTYSSRMCKFYQFDLPLRCVPKCANVKVYPEVLNFGSLPQWQVGNQEIFKVVKISNISDSQCRVSIHKILDPLDLESIVGAEESLSSRNSEISSENSKYLPNSLEQDVKNILDLCLQNLDNYFHFDPSYFILDGRSEVKIKVFFNIADYVGDYFEKYVLNVYENVDSDGVEAITCQEISILAETTGHFLQVFPECLDFHECVPDSCYQQSFEVYNNSSHTQAISIKFPKIFAELVRADVSHFYLPARSKRVVWLKFIPRKFILKNSANELLDETNNILEFPVSLNAVSKSHQSYPPVKLTVFAIMTNSDDLAISISTQAFVSNFLDSIIFDMGLCSTCETIVTEIFLVNNSLVPQICGFYDIPEIFPNQGYVKLKPNERKKIELFLSPDVKDFSGFDHGNPQNRDEFIFRLGVDSVYNVGKIKTELNGKAFTNSTYMMLQAMSMSERDTELYDRIKSCLSALKKDLSNPSQSLYNATSAKSVINLDMNDLKNNMSLTMNYQNQRPSEINMNLSGSELNYNNFVILETNRRKAIWCKVTLVRPLLEFSHQYVEFPDTPCGSYSVMEVNLKALGTHIEKQCDFNDKEGMSYSANFKIVGYGSSEEISIEPKCGTLKPGEQIKLMLVARPNIPEEIIQQKARAIRYQDIFERKLEELKNSLHKRVKKGSAKDKAGGKAKKEKDSKKKNNTEEKPSKKDKDEEKKSKKTEKSQNTDKNKGKKDKKNSVKPTEEAAPEQHNFEQDIVINEKELECDYFDLYPAEMVYWRNMEAYYIKANFVCHITYEKSKELKKKKEKIYLEATCKVVRPDFKTNLNFQGIDFGKCVIGMDIKKMVYLQNIKYKKIVPKFSRLNPVGPFSVSHFKNLVVPPEHTLNIPLKFSPEKEGFVTEYFEIRSEATVLPLILNGEGVSPILQVIPEFSVYRLEVKKKKLGEIQFTLANHSESAITILLKKVFELDGIVERNKLLKQDEAEKSGDKKDGQKDKKSQKDKKAAAVKEKGPKFSEELTELEKETVETFFNNTEGPSYFDTSLEGSYTSLEPDQQKSFKIFFGDPQLLEKQRAKKEKKSKKDKFPKTNKNTDKDSSKSDKKDKKSDKRSTEDKKEEKSSQKSSEASSDGSKKSSGGKKGNKPENQHMVQYNIFVGKTFIKNIILICTLC